MLASLAGDPRSLDELALAWSRYRPARPLLELKWREATAPSAADQWLAIDLTARRYAWCDPDDIPAEPGCYEPDDVDVADRNPLAWLNVPPWWQQVPAAEWSFALWSSRSDEPPTSSAEIAVGLTAAATEQARSGIAHVPLDFRRILYGRPLLKYVAEQTLAGDRKGPPKRQLRDAIRSELPRASHERAGWHDELTNEERAQVQRWEEQTKRIHARWLMTPRAELANRPPRIFLHEHRSWKDRELDFRRSQWSLERRPPPPASLSSDLFRFGPMGTEEVMSYFDLCRHVIGAALQLVDDEPTIGLDELIDRLAKLRDGWLASEAMAGDGMSVQEVIDGERRLMPRVASSNPIDCDCPLCRMHALQPEMFGPAFSMCDAFREDMEEDFVFSLQATKEEWTQARDEWLSWGQSRSESSEEGEQKHDHDDHRAAHDSSQPEFPEGEWSQVWQSSSNDMSHGHPGLSLLGIGAHLGEIIEELKRIEAAREEIDQLNRAFDELAGSIRRWLTREATAERDRGSDCAEPAAGHMIQTLEALTRRHPELTAKSADLQSQIHQWQRQLAPSPGRS